MKGKKNHFGKKTVKPVVHLLFEAHIITLTHTFVVKWPEFYQLRFHCSSTQPLAQILLEGWQEMLLL